MSWLDDFYRIVGKGDVRDSDFIRDGESFYCPPMWQTPKGRYRNRERLRGETLSVQMR